MSLSISLSLPLSLATSIHASPDPDLGSLSPVIQHSILHSIVSAVKSLPADSSTWNLDSEEPPSLNSSTSLERERSRSSASPPSPRVSFSENDVFIPIRSTASHPHLMKKRRSSLKNGGGSHAHFTALPPPPSPSVLQNPAGPDISFPSAQFVFEVRRRDSGMGTKSLAVAAHGGITSAELALAIWRKEGVPMREQRLFLGGGEEIYNGEVHERGEGVYELMRLKGKVRHIGQGSVVLLVVGHGRRSPRMG